MDRPWLRKFLGFSLLARDRRIHIAPQSVKKVKDKIRSLTQRSAAVSMSERIRQLDEYLGGWIGYFALAELPSAFKSLDGWLRRRLRMCQWHQWKRARTRARELRALGLPALEARKVAGTQKGYWRISGSPPLSRALTNAYWHRQGLVPLEIRYAAIRKAW